MFVFLNNRPALPSHTHHVLIRVNWIYMYMVGGHNWSRLYWTVEHRTTPDLWFTVGVATSFSTGYRKHNLGVDRRQSIYKRQKIPIFLVILWLGKKAVTTTKSRLQQWKAYLICLGTSLCPKNPLYKGRTNQRMKRNTRQASWLTLTYYDTI